METKETTCQPAFGPREGACGAYDNLTTDSTTSHPAMGPGADTQPLPLFDLPTSNQHIHTVYISLLATTRNHHTSLPLLPNPPTSSNAHLARLRSQPKRQK